MAATNASAAAAATNHATMAVATPLTVPHRRIASGATRLATTKPIAPAIIPAASARASWTPFIPSVTERLARATDGAPAKTPAKRFGANVSASRAKSTTRTAPATAFRVTSSTASMTIR